MNGVKSVSAHLRSLRWWIRGQFNRPGRPLMAGDSVGLPDGGRVVLAKDWDEMTIQEMREVGAGPATQPDFYVPFPLGARVPSRRAFRRHVRRMAHRRTA